MKLTKFTYTVLTFCIAIVSGTQAAEAASFSVIASGLDKPRGLTFGSDDSLYVIEAGAGGTGACVPSPSRQTLCYGTSGAVTRISNDTQERILTGLPSLGLPDGTGITYGPQDILFNSTGKPYVLVGYAANPALRDSTFGDTALGKIIAPNFKTNSWTIIADLASYELANNPDQGDVVSNPAAFLIDGNNFIVADASGNDLLSLGTDGSNLRAVVLPRQTLTNPVFPPSSEELYAPPPGTSDSVPSQFEIQPVPTGVAKGPDGAYYVSQFTSFPFPEGEAKIYRVGSDGQPTVYADGFTQLADLTFDAEGNLYALQNANQSAWKGNLDGSLIEIAPDGTRTILLSGNGLESPSALTIGPDDAIYVTNRSNDPGQGQVLRLDPTTTTPVPEPSSFLGVLALGGLSFGSLLLKHKRQQLADRVVTCQKPCGAEA